METPLYVVRALAEVRESAATNMFDRAAVEMLVEDQLAAEWLSKCSSRQYMNALNDMGAAESDDFLADLETEDAEHDFDD